MDSATAEMVRHFISASSLGSCKSDALLMFGAILHSLISLLKSPGDRFFVTGSGLPSGLRLCPGYLDRVAQAAMLAALREVMRAAPIYTPRMPKSGKLMSVRMTNCGALGWVTDERGYRYQTLHPDTGAAWPPIPDIVLAAWDCTRIATRRTLPRRWSRSRLATLACSGSADTSAATPRVRSSSPQVMRSSLAARRGSPSTASTGSCPAPRRCCPRAVGST